MSLEASLATDVQTLRARALELDGHLNALRSLMPQTEDVRRAYSAVRLSLGAIHATITSMESTLGAARMTGAIGQPVKAADLELHPKNLPAQVPQEQLLASLHRVGDHTLDDETEGRGV